MEFKIELVPDKNNDFTHPQPLSLGLYSGPPILDTEIFSSYISCHITTVQPAKKYFDSEPACLVILCFVFHPAPGRRFSLMEISCSLGTTHSSNELEIVELAPHESYGGYSKVDKSWTLGLSLPFKATTPFGGEAGIEPSASHTTSKAIDHYMVITGSRRGEEGRRCVWILEENRACKGGLPLEFHSAMILRCKAEFELDIIVKGKLSGGVVSRNIKSKNLAVSKVNPTVLFGRQLQTKESLDEIKLTSWFSGAMDDSTVALNSVIPRP